MTTKELTAQKREISGSGEARRLRREGLIPAVLYGHGEPLSLSVNAQEFNRTFKKIPESEIIQLSIGTDARKVLIKDYQRNYLKGTIAHLDFIEITKGQILRTHVPVHLDGSAPGIREGGILEHALHVLDIECASENLPESIHVDISTLVIGHAIHVRDIQVPKGVKVLTNPDQVLASVTHSRAESAPAAEAVAAEAAPAAEKGK